MQTHRTAASPNVLIRPFHEADYDGVVAVENRAYPEYGESVAEWRHHDTHREPKVKWRRFVAERDGAIVGFGGYNQPESMYHPHKFLISVTVDPDHRRARIGSALYDTVVSSLEDLEPVTYFASVREDHGHGRQFADHRGFVEVMREWENHLALDRFDAEGFADRVAAVEAQGLRIQSLAELRDEPDFGRRLHDVNESVAADVPSPDAHTPRDYETWIERLWTNPGLLADGYFIARDGDRFVGVSALWQSQGSPDLYTGLTGVRREYRRRGVAVALKVASLTWAKHAGYPKVKTWNATANEGMLAINEALGFEKQPAWIEYARDLDSE